MGITTNLWLESIASAISVNTWLAPFLALVAGILTSITPCALSSVPLVIGYVGGAGQRDARKAFWLSAVFALGMSLTFTVLGTVASLLGRLLHGTGSWWYIFLGVLMLLMALQIWGIYDFVPSSYAISKNTKRGFGGAFLAGILGGFFSSPCATPVLVVLLAVVAQEGSLMWGILLLLLYSLGHSFLILIAGTSVGFVHTLSSSEKYGKLSNLLKILMGLIIMCISFYMFYIGF
ncbi:cytochrome c biogenesis protein transmembrane region [Desulfitobacterium hafniense DCB-2]|uniref:Cytochrome c biogenesis protein transmembrane region n=1 Tax=Desulfitobacterium hafniense (strain DSM 10664 / DCB-2) TaxID=272564 RepID=B8G160_DESHD|nr:cytochrome c biogenesis protein CcdA [Desulfitobacterium hafniense]ACL19275.1 cytochrome c biogenesis protein transmembrane region [Desulfitobacterium hafniense DCB-2]